MATSETVAAYSSAAFSLKGAEANCIYCYTPLVVINEQESKEEPGLIGFDKYWTQRLCQHCGWWTLDYLAEDRDFPLETIYHFAYAFGVLERFDISSTEVPIKELRRHLMERYGSRFDVHPRKLEELVADLFREHGYEVELTSYSKDGGIDLYLLFSNDSKPAAVQIKRNKLTRKIGVADIDTFLGTLLRNEIHQGIYVTTSDFTHGALKAASAPKLKEQSYFLDLWNADKLFDALKANRGPTLSSAEIAWKIREVMPIEHEMSGDWGPGEWPVEERSVAHMTWWLSKVSHFSRNGLSFRCVTEILPEPASKKQVLEWLEEFRGGDPCEVWYLTGGKFISGEHLYCMYGTIQCTRKGTKVTVIGDGPSREEITKEDSWYVKAGYREHGGILNLDTVINIRPRSLSSRDYVRENWDMQR